MKKIILFLALNISTLSFGNELFLEYALGLKKEIFTAVEKCGLNVVNVQNDYLNVPADRLIFSPEGMPLARFKQWGGVGGNVFEWKNPNGGMVHSIRQGYTSIDFVTPLQGTVAQVNQFTTIGGRGYNYLCRSTYLPNFNTWDVCVHQLFVNVVTAKLCRFGRPVAGN